MKKLNQSGYGIIEILLIIVALTIVGGTGFYVYNANKDSSKSQQESSIAKKEAKEDEVVQATADPTKDWKIYKSKHGFSIKYPQNWKLNDNNIEEYADLPSAEKNGRDHFSLTYYPSKNTAQEGPAAFAGGNVKVEIFFLTNLNKDIDQWIEDEKNNYYHKTNNMLIRDVKIGKHTGKNLTYDGGVYGGGGSTLYLLIKNTGFRASLISEDGKNPPAEALQVISTFEY